MTSPIVSVLLPVRGPAPWLSDALDSVAAQRVPTPPWQSRGPVQLVVVDDGATDSAVEVLRSIERTATVVRGDAGRGLACALNLGLRWCTASFIARLDADDAMSSGRLARQVSYMLAHPSRGLLATAWREIDERGRTVASVYPACGDAALRRELIRRNPLAHSSVMLRRSALDAVGGGYDESFRVAQDYDLWMRMSRVCELACLPDVLTVRRRHAAQVSALHVRDRRAAEARIRWGAIRRGWYPWTAAPHAIRATVAAAVSWQ